MKDEGDRESMTEGDDSFMEEDRVAVKSEKRTEAEEETQNGSHSDGHMADLLSSSAFCLAADCLSHISRLGKHSPSPSLRNIFVTNILFPGKDNTETEALFSRRRKRAEAMYAMVGRRPFLSRLTEGWIFARMISHAIPTFERRKRHTDACTLLRLLLSTPYCPGKRGHWWTRLAINLEHLGRKNDALCVAESALEDSYVRSGDRVLLQKKVLSLCKPPRRWSKPSFVLPRAARVVTIEGKLFAPGVPGKKSVFVGLDGSSTCTVEELALSYYGRKKEEEDSQPMEKQQEENEEDEEETQDPNEGGDADDEDEEEEEEEEDEGDRDTSESQEILFSQSQRDKRRKKVVAKANKKKESGNEEDKSLWGWEGMHCESGIFKTLFGMLMWEVLFADVGDSVFQTPFQGRPFSFSWNNNYSF